MEFMFQLPTRVLFGYGKSQEIDQVVKEFACKRAFIVTDKGIVQAGLVEPIIRQLEAAQVSVEVYTDVEPDPGVETVNRAAEHFTAGAYDCIIAIGGGSPIDAAKGIRVVATNGGGIADYNGVNLVKKTPPLPLIVLPTTAGTGSEVTIFGVYSDWESQVKITVTSSYMAPTVSIVDPQLTMHSPKSITAASGIDALAHAVEGFFSKAATPASNALAKEAIKLIYGSLRKAALEDDKEARINMSLGSLLAGMAFTNSYLGLTHGISSALSGHCHVPHGVAIGLLLPSVVGFNAQTHKEIALEIAHIMQLPGETAEQQIEQLVAALQQLVSDIGLPTRLQEVGVKQEQLNDIARDTFKSRMVGFNPRQPSEAEVYQLLSSLF